MTLNIVHNENSFELCISFSISVFGCVFDKPEAAIDSLLPLSIQARSVQNPMLERLIA